jgi:UTP--glucose-1-phosphate uridylyltransferase
MPKEMLPVVDKPVIQYVVEEAIESNVKNIIIVTGSNKRAIEDHFDVPPEDLVKNLLQGNKQNLLKEIEKISNMANFIYIRQKGPYGNGTPVLTAEPAIEDEPFAVLWGDEFIYSKPPRLAQMIKVYEKFGGIVISGVKIENKEDLKRYGIADLTHVENNVYKINKIIEKPEIDEAPSNIATHGGYILPPEIFSALKKVQPGRGGEIWLVDAINLLRNEGMPVYTVVIENGKYFDTGNKFEYLKTVVEFALQHNEISEEFKKFIKSLKI